MTITLRQLEIFANVAEGGHVTQASTRLLLTQSAVSMAIAELERLAGAPLFERQGRRLFLNDRGRHILPDVQDVLTKVRTIERFLEESVGEPSGVLHVGASTTIGNYMLPAIIGEFSRLYPRAQALLHIGNAQQMEKAVESGELDLGLIEGLPHIGSLSVTPWKPDELVIVVGKEHEWAAGKQASPEMLENGLWIMREKGSGTREIFEAAMGRQGITFSVALELGHTEAIKKAVEAGLGSGCLSRMAVQRELDNGWLVEIASPLDLQRTLIILTRKSEHQTTLLKAFLALLLPR
ncbi:LysR substrate-binding domain-containing protein [Geobacter sp. SVR]|uniref:LysR substrate-binding domain-containing protein n=1 Tax=Geobacter sp. SVR TaxID=2495594 RepID=UPI00143EFDB1|nr:LysR substrate-binding domain-containing protein [Geobacter sp. SVR]BCS54345.1 LysR family transcriptional regulator [Geobacter sp. SVR]GCF87486.1 LysR family transcriptional regulator [Geobacter sp. SVR]